VSKSEKNASKSTKISDFEGNPVEISGVLPVEISTIRSELSSSFTGKKIMSFGLTVEILMQKARPPPACFGPRFLYPNFQKSTIQSCCCQNTPTLTNTRFSAMNLIQSAK